MALAEDNPIHIFPTTYSLQAIKEKFGEDIHPGDLFMINDPYILGGHMNDTSHLYPVFANGREAFWLSIRMHYTDVGGMAAGSITPEATEIYQEGVCIPPIKVFEAKGPNDAFLDLFFANVRVAEERRGDFMAVVGACWTAEKRLLEILQTHRVERVEQCVEILRDKAEQQMREAISKLPTGEYCYELNMDTDGTQPDWVPVRVKVTVEPQELLFDFSESALQVPGPMNGSPASAACPAFIAIKAFLDPTPRVNGGTSRPLRVITRKGTLFEAHRPAPTCGAQDLMLRTTEASMGALAAVRNADAVGDHSSPAHVYLAGWDPIRKRWYVNYMTTVGGSGAVAEHDGSDVIGGFERGDFARVTSVEVNEHDFPVRAEQDELVADSGGAGKNRGGLGVVRQWRFLGEKAPITDMAEPGLYPNYGVLGAYGGSPSTCRIIRNGERINPQTLGKVVRFPVEKDDIIELAKWGGGGYGDPLEREPERVLEDALEGCVTPERARDLYGVVLKDGAAVETKATERLREELQAQRWYLPAEEVEDDLAVGRTRVWSLSPALVEELGVMEGEVLECVTTKTAPLRGRVQVDGKRHGRELPLGPFARKALLVQGGDLVWIRRVGGETSTTPPAASGI